MNTATHVLTAAAVLSKRDAGVRNWAVLFGGVLPDLSIFVLFGWARLVQGVPEMEVWRKLYWQEPWQQLGAISNSFPIWLLVAVIAFALGSRIVMLLALAVLVHLALDFPVHATDAHKHFWPVTDWRFHSPFSYWDSRHHAGWVMLVELGLMLTCMIVLWRRFDSRAVRAGLGVALALLFAVPAYFWITLG